MPHLVTGGAGVVADGQVGPQAAIVETNLPTKRCLDVVAPPQFGP
jgi:hypothetical protein